MGNFITSIIVRIRLSEINGTRQTCQDAEISYGFQIYLYKQIII